MSEQKFQAWVDGWSDEDDPIEVLAASESEAAELAAERACHESAGECFGVGHNTCDETVFVKRSDGTFSEFVIDVDWIQTFHARKPPQ